MGVSCFVAMSYCMTLQPSPCSDALPLSYPCPLKTSDHYPKTDARVQVQTRQLKATLSHC